MQGRAVESVPKASGAPAAAAVGHNVRDREAKILVTAVDELQCESDAGDRCHGDHGIDPARKRVLDEKCDFRLDPEMYEARSG
jgi:hypothetical protein